MLRNLSLIIRSAGVLLLALACLHASGQDYRAHNWYFGNTGAGIRFNRSDNTASLVSNGQTQTTGGAAVATDPINGNLLFYTDGQNIYDASHQVMFGNTPLGGSPTANQPVAIARAPGQPDRFFVFVNTANGTTGGTVTYWTVDLSLPGNAAPLSPPLGEVVATNAAVPGLVNVSEAMVAISHDNGEDFFLVTHEQGTPDYFVTLFSSGAPPQTTEISGVGLIEVANNFAYHAPTGRIAVSTQEANRDVELLLFNNANGGLTFTQRILNSAVATNASGEAIYDTEWSNSGRYLYLSRHGDTGIQPAVLQADVTSSLITLQNVLPQSIAASYGLQMAPDSIIYHLYQETSGGPFLAGAITRPDTVAAEVNYNPAPFAGQDFGGMQFPSFADTTSVTLTVTFTHDGSCANTPVAFYPTVDPAADSLVWDFGDNNGGFGWSPVYTYTDAGAYNVTVTAFLRGETATYSELVNIAAFDLQLELVQDTTACACELPINNGKPMANGELCPDDTGDDMTVKVKVQNATPTYQWFGPGGILPDETTEILHPDSAGYYYVVASMAGCSAYAGVNIKEYDSLNQQMNIWHFGNTAGIDFNGLPESPAVGIVGPLNANEGTSVICDRNGQVVLSTDGQNVFGRGADGEMIDITPTPNPPGLGGDPGSTQSALIMPVPGDETLFYVFTTQAVDGPSGVHQLKYSLYDIKRNNGAGEFIIFNQVLFARSTERITSNGNWLIAHEFGNNSFRAYPIGPFGIGNPVISAIGSDHTTTVLEHGQGYMEIGGPNRIAVALSTPGVSNVVEIFDFVDSTGAVTNFRTADLETPNGQVYGIELFGDKLYVSVLDGNSSIHEFFFDENGNVFRRQDPIEYPGERIGAMQIGPDGMVYVAREGSSALWTFSPVGDTLLSTPLNTLQEFPLAAGTTSRLGLPNFIQTIASPVMTPSFTFTGTCAGDSTIFEASGKDSAIDEFSWAILGENGAVPLDNPQQDGSPRMAQLFEPGTYTVTVTITNKCEPNYQVFSETITINPKPPAPLGEATICNGPAILDANEGDLPDLTYLWSTGETTETITVTEVRYDAGEIFEVTITDAQGCTSTGSIHVDDNRPEFDFDPNMSICQNVALPDLDAGNPGGTYEWFLQDNPNGNTGQTQDVDTSAPGVFEYAVEVTNPATGCFRRDSIIYTINESPTWTATPTDPPACGTPTGQISLVIDSPDGSLFSWFVTGPVAHSGTDQPADVPFATLADLSAGAYAVTVADQISGCATTNTVSINDPAFTVLVGQDGTCDPDIRINVTTGEVDGINYRVLDDGTGTEVGNGTSPTGDFLTFTLASGGTYVVEVTNPVTTCVASSMPLQLNANDPITITFDNTNICVDNTLTAVASGGTAPYDFDWTASPAGSLSPTTGPTVEVEPGTWVLIVTADDNGASGLCPGTATTTLTVEPPIAADFTQSDACADQVVLSASPTGTFTYIWYRAGVAVPGGGGQQILAQLADDQVSYRVELMSNLSGCVYPSAEKTVNVAGDIGVTLATTTPCEGNEFTLTATPSPTTITTFIWTYEGATLPTTTDQHVGSKGGKYEVFVTQSGCTVSDLLNIVPAPSPEISLFQTYFLCPGETLPLDAGPGFLSYEWFESGLPTTETGQVFEVDEPGIYAVNVMNQYGCLNSDETTVVEKCDPKVTAPTAFRPAGLNQTFNVFTLHVADEDFQIFIFNRWGEMVFQDNQPDFQWNGGYNNNTNQPLPPGTYTYLVKFKSVYDDEKYEQRGGVVLLR